MWEQLNPGCMTEESDGYNGSIITHKLQWRSEGESSLTLNYYSYLFLGLTNWITRLKNKIDADDKTTSSFKPTRKTRIEGTPSNAFPPIGTPDWAICPDWKKGMYKNLLAMN